MNRYNVTLYFETEREALDAGYCDAVMVSDNFPDDGYMGVITFECTSFQIEEEDESLDIDLDLLCEEVA